MDIYPVKDDIEQGQRMCENTESIGHYKTIGYECYICHRKVYAKGTRRGRRNYRQALGAIRQHIKSHFPIETLPAQY